MRIALLTLSSLVATSYANSQYARVLRGQGNVAQFPVELDIFSCNVYDQQRTPVNAGDSVYSGSDVWKIHTLPPSLKD